jgi:hypothetical protein
LDLADVSDQIVMGQHHPFRQAGGAAGIRQHDQILFGVDLYPRR